MSGGVDEKLTQLPNELRNTLLGVQILFAGRRCLRRSR